MFPVPSRPPITKLTRGTRKILNEGPLDGPIVRQVHRPPTAVVKLVLGVGYVLTEIAVRSVVTGVGGQAGIAAGQQPGP